jgi:uncharacterized membrane protein
MAQESIISKISIGGHPIHPMLIHFPVAALVGLIASDMGYWMTADYFWARASVWLAGIGAIGGWISGMAGLLDLLLVPRIRRLITAWCHAILAVMMLSLASLNWLLRIDEPAGLLLPWGIFLSCITGVLISAAGYLGGQLVYEHGVGVEIEASVIEDVTR